MKPTRPIFLVVMAAGKYPFPFRTRKSSPPRRWYWATARESRSPPGYSRGPPRKRGPFRFRDRTVAARPRRPVGRSWPGGQGGARRRCGAPGIRTFVPTGLGAGARVAVTGRAARRRPGTPEPREPPTAPRGSAWAGGPAAGGSARRAVRSDGGGSRAGRESGCRSAGAAGPCGGPGTRLPSGARGPIAQVVRARA
jgi:hypothetical protein